MKLSLARRSAVESPARRRALGKLVRAGTIVVALAACIPFRHHESPVPLQSPARDTLLLADLHRTDTLVARGIAATRAAYFADDIVFLRPGAPAVFGRDNVMSFLAANAGPGGASAWQPVGAGLSRDGLSGYTFGIAVHGSVDGRAPGIDRYIAFWTRRRGTEWKISAFAEVGAASPSATVQPASGTTIPVRSGNSAAAGDAASIIRADSEFAESSSLLGPATAFADAVAPDGVVFAGPQVLVGPRAIHDYYEQQRGTSIIWHPTYAVAAGSRDLGFSIGESVVTSRGPSGAAVQRFGKYLTVWRRQPNGEWKFVVDGGSPRPSPVGS